MFKEFGITLLIASCQSSVMADLERNQFFDNEITKAVVFISVHDAVLFASGWDLSEEKSMALKEAERRAVFEDEGHSPTTPTWISFHHCNTMESYLQGARAHQMKTRKKHRLRKMFIYKPIWIGILYLPSVKWILLLMFLEWMQAVRAEEEEWKQTRYRITTEGLVTVRNRLLTPT